MPSARGARQNPIIQERIKMANRRNSRAAQAAANMAQSAEAQADAIVNQAALENAQAIEAAEQAIEAAQFIGPWPYAQPQIEAPSADDIAAEESAEAEFQRLQREADAKIEAAIIAAQNAPSARSGEKKPYIRQSSIIRPTKAVWAIADAMIAHADENELPRPSRGEIIARCIAQGIASGTSATQYQAWKKAMGY